MTRIRLNEIKRFNPALVYALEPESMPGMNYEDKIDNYLYLENYVGQQTDIFEALLYAQNEVLP